MLIFVVMMWRGHFSGQQIFNFVKLSFEAGPLSGVLWVKVGVVVALDHGVEMVLRSAGWL